MNPHSQATTLEGSKSFCIAFFTGFAVLMSMTAGLNWVCDPTAKFQTGILPPIVQPMRRQKLELIEARSQPIEVLVLGSSRVLQLDPEYLQDQTGMKSFNAGVNHGRLEDALGLLRFTYQRQGTFPKLVLLGLDVAAFDSSVPEDARLTQTRELYELVPEGHDWRQTLESFSELFSWHETRNSIDSLQRVIGLKKPSDRPIESLRDDGMLQYHRRDQQLESGQYDFAAALQYNLAETQRMLSKMPSLSEKSFHLLHGLLDECRHHDCHIIAFLTPYHPTLRNQLKEIDKLENFEDQICERVELWSDSYSMRFHDLRSVSHYGGQPSRFYDGIHPDSSETRRMIDLLLSHERQRLVHALQ